MPAGADACYKAVVEVTAKEVGYLLKYEDFPFISAEQAAGHSYYFRTYYAGSATYREAFSSVVKVTAA